MVKWSDIYNTVDFQHFLRIPDFQIKYNGDTQTLPGNNLWKSNLPCGARLLSIVVQDTHGFLQLNLKTFQTETPLPPQVKFLVKKTLQLFLLTTCHYKILFLSQGTFGQQFPLSLFFTTLRKSNCLKLSLSRPLDILGVPHCIPSIFPKLFLIWQAQNKTQYSRSGFIGTKQSCTFNLLPTLLLTQPGMQLYLFMLLVGDYGTYLSCPNGVVFEGSKKCITISLESILQVSLKLFD